MCACLYVCVAAYASGSALQCCCWSFFVSRTVVCEREHRHHADGLVHHVCCLHMLACSAASESVSQVTLPPPELLALL